MEIDISILAHINTLMNNSGTDIYMYDTKSSKSFILENGEFIEITHNLEGLKARIHPEDVLKCEELIKTIKYNPSNSFSFNLRFLENNEYNYYEHNGLRVSEDGELSYILIYRKNVTLRELEKEKTKINSNKAHDKIKFILDEVPIPIYIKDPITQEISYMNNSFAKTYVCVGKSKNISQGLSKESYENIIKTELEVLRTKKSYSANESIELSNQETLYTFVKKLPITFEGKDQILSIRFDLSESKKLENIEKLLSTSLPAINAFTWKIDTRTGKITYGNPLGRLSSLDTIEKYAESIHPDDRHLFLEATDWHTKNEDNIRDLSYRANFGPSGEYEWWEPRGGSEVIYEEDSYYTIIYGMTLNIDKLKQNEKKLTNLAIERENRIKELKEAKIKAEKSERLKSQFLANMSHEIRTPLNAIVGFADVLVDTDPNDLDSKMEYSNIIRTNTDILLRLIDDIIDLSNIETGMEVNIVKCDFSKHFNQLANSLKARCDNPNVEIIIANPYSQAIAEVDFVRISQTLTNYFTNAVKNTFKGSITIGYSYDEVNSIMETYVKDTGIGIPDDKKHLVFQRFQKLDYFKQGAGLGLSIVKAIADQFGVECGFESTENVGSYFWVRGYCPMTTKA